jgi:hypothetical protein
VGRTEIITPEMESAVRSSARKYLEGTAEAHAEAVKMIAPYGRFADPILRQMSGDAYNSGDTKASQAMWDFMNAALNSLSSKR